MITDPLFHLEHTDIASFGSPCTQFNVVRFGDFQVHPLEKNYARLPRLALIGIFDSSERRCKRLVISQGPPRGNALPAIFG